jgi:hypothetical protein
VIRTQVQFTEDQIEALRERATREQTSVAELVRRAVGAWVVQETSWEQRKRRAREVAGRYRSGRSDVSRRHDEALAEAFGS